MNVKINLHTQNVIELGESLTPEIGCVILEEINTSEPIAMEGYQLGYRWTNYITQGIRVKEWTYNNAEKQIIKWAWLHDFALRIIVPKSTLQANRDLLIFKSYAEIMGLPYEILPEEVHFYCNEILEEDKPTIAHFNLTVEKR